MRGQGFLKLATSTSTSQATLFVGSTNQASKIFSLDITNPDAVGTVKMVITSPSTVDYPFVNATISATAGYDERWDNGLYLPPDHDVKYTFTSTSTEDVDATFVMSGEYLDNPL